MDLLRKLWTFLWGDEDYYTRGSQAVSNDGVFDKRDYPDDENDPEDWGDDEDLEWDGDYAEDEDDEDFEDDEDDDGYYEDEEE